MDNKEKFHLNKYIKIMESYLQKEIDVLEFEKNFLTYFKEEKFIFSTNNFWLLNDLFSDVDAFCYDEKLRGEYDIGEEELFLRVRQTLKELESLNLN